jgi:hypothetical protein
LKNPDAGKAAKNAAHARDEQFFKRAQTTTRRSEALKNTQARNGLGNGSDAPKIRQGDT